MINILWALGCRFSWEGIQTPFRKLKQAINYLDLAEVKQSYQKVAEQIHSQGLPRSVLPLIVGFTGYGRVSQGAQSIFDLLPHETVIASDLEDFYNVAQFSPNLLYKVIFKEKDMVKPIQSAHVFDLQDYYLFPEKYISQFERYIPYLSVVVNGIFWNDRYPRLITKEYLKKIYSSPAQFNLKVIGDITCDVGGSIECNVQVSNSGNPVYVYDPINQAINIGVAGRGPVVLAVDNLPCELPKESSYAFSKILKEFIPNLVKADFQQPFPKLELSPALKRAVILLRGKLTSEYKYISRYLNIN